MAVKTWYWPVPGYGIDSISSKYGYRTLEGTNQYHKGIDIAAPSGTKIVAVGAGNVISSGTASGYGNWIRIDHGDGYISIYGHMKAEDLFVKLGDTVSANQVISEVGSEGQSTGPHLHFQLEYNGEPVDPLRFLQSDSGPNIVGVGETDTGDVISNIPIGLYSAGGISVRQRVSGLSPQPLHAYFNIYVGDNQLLLSTYPPKPNIFQMFEYDKLDGAGETASFTLFDDNWEEIEEVLYKNRDRIYIQYGYYGTGLKSKKIKHTLQTYSLSFNSTGSIISVSTVTEGPITNLKPIELSVDTFNPTEAVKKICEEIGLIVRPENFDPSMDISHDKDDPIFKLQNDYPITYIQQKIIPMAAQEGEELFTFNVDDEGVAYFKRESYDSSLTDSMRTYIWQKGYDSNVIDLTFDINGVFGGQGDFDITTNMTSSAFDPDTKELTTATFNKSDVVTYATGDSTHTKSDQSTGIVDAAGYSPATQRSRLYYRMKSLRNDAYKATMKIVGDPTLNMYSDHNSTYVRIINITDAGNLHHTSGVYRVNKITDSIQGGEYTTTLELIRNASYNIDGLEILNPKSIIK